MKAGHMNHIYKITLTVFICYTGGIAYCGSVNTDNSTVYYGMSDASAAAVLGKDMFVAADDENNVLRIYEMNRTSGPVSTKSAASASSTRIEARRRRFLGLSGSQAPH